MAETERKGRIARLLEGKERDEIYDRGTIPATRWGLFWDLFKGRFGKLMLVNLMMLATFLPVAAIFIWRSLAIASNGVLGPYGAGLGVGYPVVPDIVGVAQYTLMQGDLVFFALFIPAGMIAGFGISGGAYIIRNLIWTEGYFYANDFLRGVKRNFWNVTEAVLTFTIVLFVATFIGNLADFYVATGAKFAGWLIASKVIGYILVVFALLVALWMISLGVDYKQGPWALFRNAVVLTVGTFPQSVFFAAIALIPAILAIFTGGVFRILALVVLLLFGISYAFLVWLNFSQWAFDKFVEPSAAAAAGRSTQKDKPSPPRAATAKSSGANPSPEDSAAAREYQRMIVAYGRSFLIAHPIRPLDDGVDLYQLPETFSREDLVLLRESKAKMAQGVADYAEAHKNDPQYVEYNREFDERERALSETGGDDKKKKKKAPKPPKMLNKH